MTNQQLPKELHKTFVRKYEKRKVYSSFKDNIWGVDLADMQLMSKYKKVFPLFLCLINFYSIHPCLAPFSYNY